LVCSTTKNLATLGFDELVVAASFQVIDSAQNKERSGIDFYGSGHTE
jgi:hypothetical protein